MRFTRLTWFIGLVLFFHAPSIWAQTPDNFTWLDVQSHPLAGPGGALEGLPDGNYVSPSDDQAERCIGGCVLYATVGAMEMQYAIQLREPQVTLNLSEDYVLDNHDVQNRGSGTGRFCNTDCGLSGDWVMSCAPSVLSQEGIIREETANDPSYNHIEYKITSGGFDLFDARTIDGIKQRLLEGPVVGTIMVNNTEEGSKNLSCNGTNAQGLPLPQLGHRVVFIGYKTEPYMLPSGGTGYRYYLQVKNSWGRNAAGYSSYQWVDWDSPCVHKPDWTQIREMEVSDSTQDLDGDGIPDHRDICLGVFSGRPSGIQPNLDNDIYGDECDPDMDHDRVLDEFDCHPWNRYLGFDLDADGVCDDEQRATSWGGMPFSLDPTMGANKLFTAAFVDYKSFHLDNTTDESINHFNAIRDGDTDPGVDLSIDVVCQNECDRIATMPSAERPGGFTTAACQALCDSTVTPRDNCSPYSVQADPQASVLMYSACDDLHRCVTMNEDGAHCPIIGLNASICRAWWFNPGLGQRDTDDDGTADFCDEELVVANFSVSVDTENYQSPGDIGFQTASVQCFEDEYRIAFDSWGARSPDGSQSGEWRRNSTVDACYCPGEAWDSSCDAYCPTDAEVPTANDPERNPGAGNQAWDPISSPGNCLDKVGLLNGEDYHFCVDQDVRFIGVGYESTPRNRYWWRWQPFYDPDQTIDGSHPAHPSIRYSEMTPGFTKVRVAWPAGAEPAADEKAFSPSKIKMQSGCFNLPLELESMRTVSPFWIFPPNLLFEMQHIHPNDPVSMGGFEDVVRRDSATALVGDYIVSMNPADGALRAARKISYLGAERMATSQAAKVTMGLIDSGQLTVVQGGVSGIDTPVMYVSDGVTIWLGLLDFGNTWVTWKDAFGTDPPDLLSVAGLTQTAHGSVRLVGLENVVGSNDQQWAVYETRGGDWSRIATLATEIVPQDVTGFALISGGAGRYLHFFGGAGSGWNAPVHRWDLLTGRVTEHTSQAFDDFAQSANGWGVHRAGDDVYLAASRLLRFNLTTRATEVISHEVPEGLGVSPYIYFDPDANTLSAMTVGGQSEPNVLRLELDGEDEWRASGFLDTEPAPVGHELVGTVSRRDLQVLLFEVTPENAGKEHRAHLVASNGKLGLQLFDAMATLVAEDRSDKTTNDILFTPAAEAMHYVLRIVPASDLGADEAVGYHLTVSPVAETPVPVQDDESGCGCRETRGPRASWAFLLVALGLLLRWRKH